MNLCAFSGAHPNPGSVWHKQIALKKKVHCARLYNKILQNVKSLQIVMSVAQSYGTGLGCETSFTEKKKKKRLSTSVTSILQYHL